MTLRNTDDSYGAVARILHWATALLIFGLIPVGLFMTQMENSPDKLEVYALHKSFGLTVLWLVIARLCWKVISLPPDPLETHAPWERGLARLVHGLLYAAIIALPLSGWLMSSAAEFPVPFFGLEMPDLASKNETLFRVMRDAHEILAYSLLGVLALHVAGALKHHILDRDDTLRRMTFAKAGIAFAALLVFMVTLVYVSAGFLTLLSARTAPMVAEAPQVSAAVQAAEVVPGQWVIVPDQSTIEFESAMYGAPFTGRFGRFDGSIVFDPADLASAKADIRIDMASAVTDNEERDGSIGGPEWFDAAGYPEARFETIGFEPGADGQYVAIGNLTIKGITMPVTLPFTLSVEDIGKGRKMAVANGGLTLNRRDFNVGSGPWARETDVAYPVQIRISLTAVAEE